MELTENGKLLRILGNIPLNDNGRGKRRTAFHFHFLSVLEPLNMPAHMIRICLSYKLEWCSMDRFQEKSRHFVSDDFLSVSDSEEVYYCILF